MILTARLGGPQVYSGPGPCELETTAVRAPLEAVVEEADATWPSRLGHAKLHQDDGTMGFTTQNKRCSFGLEFGYLGSYFRKPTSYG